MFGTRTEETTRTENYAKALKTLWRGAEKMPGMDSRLVRMMQLRKVAHKYELTAESVVQLASLHGYLFTTLRSDPTHTMMMPIDVEI